MDDLEVNQKIELEINRGQYQGTYLSKVAEINENNIKVIPPYQQGELIPLHISSTINIFYTTDRAAFKFSTRIIGREKEPIPLLVILPPENITRIQRRDFFRLDIREKVKYCRIDEEGEPVGDYIKTTTCDISGGGAKLKLEEKLSPDTLLQMYINIPEIKDIPIEGRIVQNYDQPEGEAVGVEFIDINSRVRDIIIGWLFEHQRRLRRKGML